MLTAVNRIRPNDITDTPELCVRTCWVSKVASERGQRVLTKHWQWKPINENSSPQARRNKGRSKLTRVRASKTDDLGKGSAVADYSSEQSSHKTGPAKLARARKAKDR